MNPTEPLGNPTRRPWTAIVALAIVVLSGVAQGLWAGRWAVSHELEAAVARIGRIPAPLDDWEGRAVELDPEMIARAEADGHLSRRYRRRRDGAEVSVLLLCGRPGPISLHPPDVCYLGAGYDLVGEPAATRIQPSLGGRPSEFRKAEFRKRTSIVPQGLVVFWSWNGEGAWEGPDDPRLRFAPYRALYKLYVVGAKDPTVPEAGESVVEDFLRRYLPVLDGALFPGGAS